MACCMSAMLISTAAVTIPELPFTLDAEAHSGRTDSNGGHKDNKNKSGLGSYHYHCGGYPAHQHSGGVCPYAGNGTTKETEEAVKSTEAPETKPEVIIQGGWQLDEKGWWYLEEDGSYPKEAWKEVSGVWYYFGEDGYLLVNTVTPDGNKVDENGAWVQ